MQMGIGHAIITKQRVMNGISFSDVAACAAFEAEEGFVFVQILPGCAAKDRPADGIRRTRLTAFDLDVYTAPQQGQGLLQSQRKRCLRQELP